MGQVAPILWEDVPFEERCDNCDLHIVRANDNDNDNDNESPERRGFHLEGTIPGVDGVIRKTQDTVSIMAFWKWNGCWTCLIALVFKFYIGGLDDMEQQARRRNRTH